MRRSGFTLAELLIALAILGVIATFTIPKVLSAQGESKNNAIAKEAAATVSDALQQYRLTSGVKATTSLGDFLDPKLNHVRKRTSGLVNHRPGLGTVDCADAAVVCYDLHNGGTIWYYTPYDTFGGTTANHFVLVGVDPSGANDATESVEFFLLATGRLDSRGTHDSNPALDPAWFSWTK